ncbi:MAG TPA: heme-binding domain-containing protein [Bacteroidales bacterium]
MKKTSFTSFLIPGFLILGMFLLTSPVKGQEAANTAQALPDSINIIVSFSCVPCHTSQGGLMSKAKLNFTEWTNYSPEKQKEKASKMFSELDKGAMPPKSTREKRPELIPTKEQVETIKKWSESFVSDSI